MLVTKRVWSYVLRLFYQIFYTTHLWASGITLGVLFFSLSALSALASVSDQNLDDCLKKIGKKNQWSSPLEFTEIVCHNKGIVSLEGLEAYSHIEKLSLHKNKIQAFDGASFKELKVLNLGRNRLEGLTLDQMPNLIEVYIFNNNLKNLTLTNLPTLQRFKANSNVIQTFTYRNLPVLKKVYLFDNEMEHIDIYSLPSMKYMDVRQNPMPDELYEKMDQMKGVTILHDGNADDWD